MMRCAFHLQFFLFMCAAAIRRDEMHHIHPRLSLGYFFPLCSLLACPGFWLVFGLSYFVFTLLYFISFYYVFFSELWLSFAVGLFLRFPLHFVCFIFCFIFIFVFICFLILFLFFVFVVVFVYFVFLSSNVYLLLTYVCCACRTQY